MLSTRDIDCLFIIILLCLSLITCLILVLPPSLFVYLSHTRAYPYLCLILLLLLMEYSLSVCMSITYNQTKTEIGKYRLIIKSATRDVNNCNNIVMGIIIEPTVTTKSVY